MNLEEKIAKLDQLATEIEDNEIPLEKAIAVFEESVGLASDCMKTLNDLSGKLTVLTEQVRRLTDDSEE